MKKTGIVKRFVKSNFLTVISGLGALISCLILRFTVPKLGKDWIELVKIGKHGSLTQIRDSANNFGGLLNITRILIFVFVACLIIFIISLFGIRRRMLYTRVADMEKYMQHDVEINKELLQTIQSDKDKDNPRIMSDESNMNLF